MHALGFEHHDHQGCKRAALAAAETHCARHRLNFTPQRRRVLEILLGAGFDGLYRASRYYDEE